MTRQKYPKYAHMLNTPHPDCSLQSEKGRELAMCPSSGELVPPDGLVPQKTTRTAGPGAGGARTRATPGPESDGADRTRPPVRVGRRRLLKRATSGKRATSTLQQCALARGTCFTDLRRLASLGPMSFGSHVAPELDEPEACASIEQQHMHALRFNGACTVLRKP